MIARLWHPAKTPPALADAGSTLREAVRAARLGDETGVEVEWHT